MPSTASVSIQDFVRGASHAAHHFGFSPLEKLKAHPACKTCAVKIEHKATAQDRKNDALSGMLTSGMCTYFDSRLNGIEGHPFSILSIPYHVQETLLSRCIL